MASIAQRSEKSLASSPKPPKENKQSDRKRNEINQNSSEIKEHLQDDPFLCVMDECTMDVETGLFNIIYSEDA